MAVTVPAVEVALAAVASPVRTAAIAGIARRGMLELPHRQTFWQVSQFGYGPTRPPDLADSLERARSVRYVDARLGGSSNGRTADSDSASLGSNPSPPAKSHQRLSRFSSPRPCRMCRD